MWRVISAACNPLCEPLTLLIVQEDALCVVHCALKLLPSSTNDRASLHVVLSCWWHGKTTHCDGLVMSPMSSSMTLGYQRHVTAM